MTGPLRNARHERFAQEYLVDLKAGPAYSRAGYKSEGNARDASAAALLRNPKVAARIAELQAERSDRTKIDADWVLRRLADEMSADVADLYDDDGRVKPIRQWPMIWRQGLVAGIETIPEKVGDDAEGKPIIVNGYRIKLASRDKRLEMLGKHVYVSAFREQVDHTSSDGSMTPPSLADFYAGKVPFTPPADAS